MKTKKECDMKTKIDFLYDTVHVDNADKVMPIRWPDGKPVVKCKKTADDKVIKKVYRDIISGITPDATKISERVKLNDVQSLKEALYDSLQEYRKTPQSQHHQTSSVDDGLFSNPKLLKKAGIQRPVDCFGDDKLDVSFDSDYEKAQRNAEAVVGEALNKKDQALVRRLVVQEIRDAGEWEDVVMATQALLKVRSFIEKQVNKPTEDLPLSHQNV
jgi:hypothetical protein